MADDTSPCKDDLVIPCWPSNIDCLDWSQDGEVAIAAGEAVQLLIPKLKIVEDAPDALWEQIRLRTTVFSPDEVEPQAPISTRSFSIGEETSTGEVTSVKWSAPGVARHGRCALVVHTQNLILAIWAPEAQPRSVKDWKRRVIVNHELQSYFEKLHPAEKQEPGKPKSEHLKELIRVRAYALCLSLNANEASSDLSWLSSFSYLAVSNDNNEVIILQCRRQEGDLGELELHALHHFSVTGKRAPLPTLGWTLEDYMQNTRFVQTLAWSPWLALNDKSLTSFVACATRSGLFFKRMVLTHNNGEPKLAVEAFEGSINMRISWNTDVLLNWLPEIYEESQVRLLACTSDAIITFTLDLVKHARIDTQKRRREEWGPVAGKIIIPPAGNRTSLVQTMPLLPTRDNFVTTLSLLDLVPAASPERGLEESVKYHKTEQNEKSDRFAGHTQTRLWGLASSPLHDISMVAATFHPALSPEYIIPADMATHLIFDHDAECEFILRAIKKRASTEAIAFSITRLVKSIRDQAQKNATAWGLLDQIDEGIAELDVPDPDVATSPFRDLLYNSVALTKLRYERILSVICNHEAAGEDAEKQIMERISLTVLHIPSGRYSSSKASRLMLVNLHRVLVYLSISTNTDFGAEIEQCEICGNDIDFGELGSAQCKAGHKFRRCALTFLAIQAPGISKSCGICGKQYLKTSYLESQEGAAAEVDVETDRGLPVQHAKKELAALIDMLSAACERCVYCGGKFTG